MSVVPQRPPSLDCTSRGEASAVMMGGVVPDPPVPPDPPEPPVVLPPPVLLDPPLFPPPLPPEFAPRPSSEAPQPCGPARRNSTDNSGAYVRRKVWITGVRGSARGERLT